MSWFFDEVRTRSERDRRRLEDAFGHLARSLSGNVDLPDDPLESADAADAAASDILDYFHLEPATVPDDVSDPVTRLDLAMKPSGVMRRKVTLEDGWWRHAAGAYVTTLTDGSFVACIPRGIRGYCYRDPRTGHVRSVNRRSARDLSRDGLCFYRPLPMRSLTTTDLLRFMRLSVDTLDYLYILLATAVTTVIGLLPAIATKILFDAIIPTGIPGLIMPIACLLLGTALSSSLIRLVSTSVRRRFGSKLRMQVEAAVYARVLLLPPSFFRDHAPGEIAHKVQAAAELVDDLLSSVIDTGLTCVFSLSYLIQIFAFAPQLAWPALAVIVIETLALATVLVADTQINRDILETKGVVSGLMPTLLAGMSKIRLAGAERRAFAKWAHAFADLSTATFEAPATLVAAPTLIPLTASVGTIVIYFLAATTDVSSADYMAFNTAFGSVVGALGVLVGAAETMSAVAPGFEELQPILDARPEARSGERQITSLTGSISMSRVSFGYDKDSAPIISDISLSISPGDYVAIVGRTGCGKSTLLRLLLGFERPQRGAIYYDGIDISGIDLRTLRRYVGVVTQSGALFAGDILMNITVACPDATVDDAWEAAEVAGIADEIRAMPMGMRTLVSEGGGAISGGQRQRIMIARAVCGGRKVLMFDEATSALDNITQKRVSDALSALSCTRIVIAHRLSTIRQASRILMLEGGRIVEDGTYDELMVGSPRFRDLVERQRLEGE